MSRRRFREGDSVRISALRSVGTVIECLGGNSYRVALTSVTMICRDNELEPTDSRPQSVKPIPPSRAPRGPKPKDTLDLHGMTVDEATRALETWLSQVVMAGLSQVRIVHGLGTGRLQRATHETIRKFPAVRAYKLNEFNPGETLVFL